MDYPVDTDKKYARQNIETGALVSRYQRWPHRLGAEVLLDGERWLVEVRGDDTPVDPATQKQGGWLYDIDEAAETVTSYRDAVDLSDSELAKKARKEGRDSMHAQWHDENLVPEYIFSTYNLLFISSNQMLDQNRDAAARMSIEDAKPTDEILADEVKLAQFNAIKAHFLSCFDALPEMPEEEIDPALV